MSELSKLLSANEPLSRRYADFFAKFGSASELPDSTLQLCRLRIAYIHDCAAEIDAAKHGIADSLQQALKQADFSELTTRDISALTLAEQVPWQHHVVSDADVAAAEQHFGAAATVALLTACAFFDVNCRLLTVLPNTLQSY